jgi:hypothetical protein
MAMYRVAVRVPDGDDVPMLLRGAQTLYGSVGEGSPREVLAGLERACAEAAEVFQSRLPVRPAPRPGPPADLHVQRP